MFQAGFARSHFVVFFLNAALNEMRTIAGRCNLVKHTKMHVNCGMLAKMPAIDASLKDKNGSNANFVK